MADTYTLAPAPRFDSFGATGLYVPGGLLWTYLAGTTTPVTVYQTPTGTAHTNPIVLDSAGRAPAGIYMPPGQSYKFVFETAATPPAHGSVLFTQDNILPVPLTSSNQDVQGTAGETMTAGQLAYLSDGSGGKTAGQWYLATNANTYSSTTPSIGFVVANVTIGGTGTFRSGGKATLTGPLTVGAIYYIDVTAGAITATLPGTNVRFIGQADTTTTIVCSSGVPSSQTTVSGLDVNFILPGQVFGG